MRLVIEGAPRTKKNSGRAFYSFKLKRNLHIPSEAYETWATLAAIELRHAWRGLPPMEGPVHVCALVYQDADRGDLVGFLQAIGDVLEAPTKRTGEKARTMKASVIVNDKQIKSWDGSRALVDPARPRVELEIEELHGP